MSATSHDDWGQRLSDRIREALARGQLDLARKLAVEGDGHVRNLEKEYALMYKGLGITVRLLLELLEKTVVGGDERVEAALAGLLLRFRRDFALEGAHGSTSARAAILRLDDLVADSPSRVTDGLGATSGLVAKAEALFDRAQARLAGEIIAAIESGDGERARALVDEKELRHYVPVHDRLVRFMAEVFDYVVQHFGRDELYRFQRATAEGQRRGFDKWERLDAAGLTRATAFLGKQHMGRLRVVEDNEKFTIVQTPCGSGGRLRLAGAYEGPEALPFVEGPGPLTLGQPRLPVYCTHCPIWNSVAPIEWFGNPQLVFDDASRPDGSCTLHVYKDAGRVPAHYYDVLGLPRSDP